MSVRVGFHLYTSDNLHRFCTLTATQPRSLITGCCVVIINLEAAKMEVINCKIFKITFSYKYYYWFSYHFDGIINSKLEKQYIACGNLKQKYFHWIMKWRSDNKEQVMCFNSGLIRLKNHTQTVCCVRCTERSIWSFCNQASEIATRYQTHEEMFRIPCPYDQILYQNRSRVVKVVKFLNGNMSNKKSCPHSWVQHDVNPELKSDYML